MSTQERQREAVIWKNRQNPADPADIEGTLALIDKWGQGEHYLAVHEYLGWDLQDYLSWYFEHGLASGWEGMSESDAATWSAPSAHGLASTLLGFIDRSKSRIEWLGEREGDPADVRRVREAKRAELQSVVGDLERILREAGIERF